MIFHEIQVNMVNRTQIKIAEIVDNTPPDKILPTHLLTAKEKNLSQNPKNKAQRELTRKNKYRKMVKCLKKLKARFPEVPIPTFEKPLDYDFLNDAYKYNEEYKKYPTYINFPTVAKLKKYYSNYLLRDI